MVVCPDYETKAASSRRSPARGSACLPARADLAALAAAYGLGLAPSHPFIDGNKRIAFVTMGVFLGLNGQATDAPEREVVTVMLELAGGRTPLRRRLPNWLRQRLVDRAKGESG